MLFEDYNEITDLKNEVLNHLSQYPYLVYSVREEGDNVLLSFNKDVDEKYISGILDIFKTKLLNKFPVKYAIYGCKDITKLNNIKNKIIINNIENIDIPSLGIKNLEVKIDTGATTSSLDVSYLKVDKDKNMVYFTPLHPSDKKYINKKYKAKIEDKITVQSSNGEETVRYLIKINIIIKGKKLMTFVSLSDREELEYPMLIGKDVLAGDFLINPNM